LFWSSLFWRIAAVGDARGIDGLRPEGSAPSSENLRQQ